MNSYAYKMDWAIKKQRNESKIHQQIKPKIKKSEVTKQITSTQRFENVHEDIEKNVFVSFLIRSIARSVCTFTYSLFGCFVCIREDGQHGWCMEKYN